MIYTVGQVFNLSDTIMSDRLKTCSTVQLRINYRRIKVFELLGISSELDEFSRSFCFRICNFSF
jgi:hypothetical protein